MKLNKIDFEWIVLGDGPLFKDIKNKISFNNLDDSLFLIGEVQNPFPYLKSSDLLILTSDYEAQPRVCIESLILGIPVLSSNFSSSYEILDNFSNSMIVEKEYLSFYNGLNEILSNNGKLLKKMKENASKYTYNNEEIFLQLNSLLFIKK